MTVKLQCRARPALAEVITDARIRVGTKEHALRKLVALALDDTGLRLVVPSAEGDGNENCTLTMTDTEYAATETYRLKYRLVTKTQFFQFALEHGAALYRANEAQELGRPPAANA